MEEQPKSERDTRRRITLHEFADRVSPSYHDLTAGLDAAAAEALEAFDAAGVDALLLKGRALATLLYGPGERRMYSDVDLLVAPSQAKVAERVLSGLGYENTDAGRRIDDVGSVVHAHTWMRIAAGAADHQTMDLHRWLSGSRASPAAAWGSLWERREWIEVAGREVAVLDRAGQAMHLAMHAAQHGAELHKHTDELVLAIERWPADIWRAAATLADEIDATDAFAAGLRLVPEGAAVAAGLALPATPGLDWTIRHRQARPRGTFHLGALAEAETFGARMRVLRRSLLPTRAWIIEQHRWAAGGHAQLAAAYALHLVRAPGWAACAWAFRRRSRRSGR